MKSKKDNFYVVLLWGVVIYAVALLSYCTMKIVFKASADYISAFGSILGACAALFAAFVAAYLFNDWKDQHNAQVRYNYIKDTLTMLRQCVIGLAPTLSSAIKASEEFIETGSILKIELNKYANDKLYEEHRQVSLLFDEYNSIFKDDSGYLEFKKLNILLEQIFISLNDLSETVPHGEKLEKITQDSRIIAFPFEIIQGKITRYETKQMRYLDLYKYLDLYYSNLSSQLARYQVHR